MYTTRIKRPAYNFIQDPTISIQDPSEVHQIALQMIILYTLLLNSRTISVLVDILHMD